ncbi:hypothetical protein ACWCYO_40615, partial [Kitasatospora sp. NPDC001683]
MPVERVLELVAVHRGAVPGVELGGLLVQLRLRELVEVCLLLKTTIWGYDGGFPGSTFVGRRGRPVSVRVRNR